MSNYKTQKQLAANDGLTRIKAIGDMWICLCLNTPINQGFYPCDSEGNYVEPTPEDWTTDWYVCDRCGRIIDQKTLRVVGIRFNNTLTLKERIAIKEEIDRFGYPDSLESE
jgi:hypothetical protein